MAALWLGLLLLLPVLGEGASLQVFSSVSSAASSNATSHRREPTSVSVGLKEVIEPIHPRARHEPSSVTVALSDEGTSVDERERRRTYGEEEMPRQSFSREGRRSPRRQEAGQQGVEFIDSMFGVNDAFIWDKDPSQTREIRDVGEIGEDPGLGDEEYHYGKVWNVIKRVRRHKHKRRQEQKRPASVQTFFESAVVYEWVLFAAALGVFFPLFYVLQDWPSTRKLHLIALFIWIGLGALYNALVWVRLGRNAGIMWFTGYLLELIFSIENVFVFHIVVKAFRTPQRLTQKALFNVICCQIVFEMIFFMGLAQRVRSMEVLPYLLGCWLLYVGYHASKDDGHEDFNIKDSSIFRFSRWCFGRRLINQYDQAGAVFVVKDRRVCVTLLFPLICCLLAVDFALEVDVTLTKIEELPNEYIAFTSSAAAAFAVPELFFVARDLFQRYTLLKQGVSFVLVFFGVQMLMHRVFEVPDLVGCAIIIIVMIGCMMMSREVTDKEIDIKESYSENSLVFSESAVFDTDKMFDAEEVIKTIEPMPEPPCKGTSPQNKEGYYTFA